jgi:glycosyltransferase involved in cell wall biosynthesis
VQSSYARVALSIVASSLSTNNFSTMLQKLSDIEDEVSLIVTVLNEEEYVGQMLDSYLFQSYKDLEIIVVNDGSTDGTRAILERYANEYENIKVVNFDVNQGKVQAQNAGFKISRGKYIAISGGDDFACYSRIKTQVKYLINHNLNFVASNLYMVDSKNHCLAGNPIFYTSEPSIYTIEQIMFGRGYPGGTILFSRDLAEKIYPMPSNLPYEDLWFNFIAVVHGKTGYIHEPLGFYRQTGKNSFGLFKSQPYKQFKKKYCHLNGRILIYIEEMKKYLIEYQMWDTSLQSSYIYSKNRLELASGCKSGSHITKYLNFITSNNIHLRMADYFLLIPELKIFLLYISRLLRR